MSIRSGEEGERARFLVVGWIATAAFVALSWLPVGGPANYRYSWLFLVPILWSAYFARRKLDLIATHFALFASALLLHDLGAFGLYRRSFVGLEFDHYVHFWFGFVGGLYAARGLARRFGLRGAGLALAVVLLVTGVGGIHEIVEGFSTMWLGPENGMLKTNGNPYDTQEDLMNNVLGSLSAWGAWVMWERGAKRRA